MEKIQQCRCGINTELVPTKLKTRPQFVLWRSLRRGDKMTKVPFQVNGSEADSSDEATWNTFDAVIKELNRTDKFDGIGFVFKDGDNLVGIDMDFVYSKEMVLHESAKQIIEKLNSYCETSPSGRGIKVIVEGTKPDDLHCSTTKTPWGSECAIYRRSRFFTITTKVLSGFPAEPQPNQDAINSLYYQLWPKRDDAGETGRSDDAGPAPENLNEVIEHLYKHNKKFRGAWDYERNDGDDKLGSPSEYDGSISTYLSGYDCSTEQIKEALKQFREKHGLDTKKLDRDDYIRRTVEGARAVGWRPHVKLPKKGEKTTLEKTVDFLSRFKLASRTSGRKLYSEVKRMEYSPADLWCLPGAIDFIRSTPEFEANKDKSPKGAISLAKDLYRAAGIELLSQVPDQEPDEADVESITDAIVAFLVQPRVFYNESGVPLNSSYARWLASLEPCDKWRACFTQPLYGRVENGMLRASISGEHLFEKCGKISKHFANVAYAGRFMKKAGLLARPNADHQIKCEGRKIRAWELHPRIIERAVGTPESEAVNA